MNRPLWLGEGFAAHSDAFRLEMPASSLPSSTSSYLDAYPLAHSKRSPHPSSAGRRQSLLSSHMMRPDDGDIDLDMGELEEATDSAPEVDMVDIQVDRSSRPPWTRHSHSSSASSVPFNRPPSSPTSDIDRTFNPLNPQAIPTAMRRHRESSGESAMMADSPAPTFAPLPILPTPPHSPSSAQVPGTLQRARSSPSLTFASTFSAFAQPTTPPPPNSRRFNSADDLQQQQRPGSNVASPGSTLSVSPNSRTGPIRRPVAGRRQNLMPKPKAHLRVAMDLQAEGSSGPGDLDIASEAALHRLSRSGASALSPRTSTAPMSASLQNRFPESIDGDVDDREQDSSGSDNDAVASVAGSVSADAAGPMLDDEMSNGRGPSPVGPVAIAEAEEKRKQAWLWNSFRERAPMGQSPGSHNRSMDVDAFSPGGSGWGGGAAVASRPNKRKMGAEGHNDRFEPYNSMAFKRRAVSPTASVHNGSNNTGASTPILGSPVLGFASVPPIAIPPLSPTSAGLGLAHSAFFRDVQMPSTSAGTGRRDSRATSPAIAAQTPARGALGMVLNGARAAQQHEATMREDEELSAKAGETFTAMSLS